jgi:hypothetical protein
MKEVALLLIILGTMNTRKMRVSIAEPRSMKF